MRGDSGDWTIVSEELSERSQGTEHLETWPGPVTRQSDLRPQDHFQRGLVEDLFADFHLCWPVHTRQDGGIPWGESMVASPTSALPLGHRGAVCGPPEHRPSPLTFLAPTIPWSASLLSGPTSIFNSCPIYLIF